MAAICPAARAPRGGGARVGGARVGGARVGGMSFANSPWLSAGGGTTLGGAEPPAAAERLLTDAVDRAYRQPGDRVALVLHLSRLGPPAPRPHHLRVARVLMQDSAQRFDGQVFSLANKDMVLLCTEPRDTPGGAPAQAPSQLQHVFARLFLADVPDLTQLLSLWRLEEDAQSLRAYLAATGVEARDPLPLPEELPASGLGLSALEDMAAHAPLAELIAEQTGMLLDTDRNLPAASRLVPAFRQLRLSLAPLNLRPSVTKALADPYLMQHFTSRLDQRLLRVLHDDLRGGGPLTKSPLRGRLPIHVALGLEAVLSPGFARMARQAGEAGLRFAIVVSPLQAGANIDLLETARGLLDAAGFELILGPLDAAALGFVAPDALQPDCVKLAWSPGLADPAPEIRVLLEEGLARIGPQNIVLQDVASEQAMAWGQARGICRFQGPFLDHAQAASRLACCPHARACTLRQCASRAASKTVAGRDGCGNLPLLDTATVQWR